MPIRTQISNMHNADLKSGLGPFHHTNLYFKSINGKPLLLSFFLYRIEYACLFFFFVKGVLASECCLCIYMERAQSYIDTLH